jgi:hypothetical protein
LLPQAEQQQQQQPQQPHLFSSQSSSSESFNGDVWELLSSPAAPTPEQQEQFVQTLAAARLTTVKVKSDGNQQFRALAHQVYGTEEAHSIVRLLVVSEILAHPYLYERNIPYRGVDIQEYAQIMSRLGVKGDHLTLTAFMNFYGADLVVYSPSSAHQFWLQSRRIASGEQPKTFYLAIVGDTYQSLLSLDELSLRARIEMIRMKNARKFSQLQRQHHERTSSENSNESDSESDDSDEDDDHENECSRHCKKLKCQHATPTIPPVCSENPTSSPHPPQNFNLTVHEYNNNNNPEIFFEKDETTITNNASAHVTRRKKIVSSSDGDGAKDTLSVRGREHHRKLSRESNSRKEKQLNVKTFRYGATKAHSLVGLCVATIVQNVECYPPFAHLLPHELLYSIFNALAEQKKLSDSNIERLLEPSMRSFILKGPCPHVTDASLIALSRKCKHLQTIEIIDCPTITDQGIVHIASNCPDLTFVTLQNCGIGDRSVQELARKCPKLTYVDLTGCTQVTDIALQELELACPNIATLIVANGPKLSDTAFEYLGRELKVLDLTNCELVSNKTLLTLASRCPKLKSLKLSGKNIR